MTDQNIKNLTQYRFERANESIEDAKLLANANHWNACVNRLYYACFYAVSALLIQLNLSSAKHTGIRSLFNQHFVKPGKIDREAAQLYNDLFEKRQEGDYVDYVYFEESDIAPLVPKVEEFIEKIKIIIQNISE